MSARVLRMRAQGGIELLVQFMAVFLIFSICAMVLSAFYGAIPTSLQNGGTHAVQNATDWVLAFFDNTFFVIIAAALFLMCVSSVHHPSEAKAIAGVFGIFILAYLNTGLLQLIVPVINATHSAALLPNMTAFMVSNFKVFLIYVFMVIDVILNVYGLHNDARHEHSNAMSGAVKA